MALNPLQSRDLRRGPYTSKWIMYCIPSTARVRVNRLTWLFICTTKAQQLRWIEQMFVPVAGIKSRLVSNQKHVRHDYSALNSKGLLLPRTSFKK
jgi:hypothetical protein